MKAKAAFYDNFYPWKDIVGKKVSKLRSIAELRTFYDNKIHNNICTGHLREDGAVRAGAPQQGVRQEHEVRVQLLQALGLRRFYRQ
jgi:hypothetical protein